MDSFNLISRVDLVNERVEVNTKRKVLGHGKATYNGIISTDTRATKYVEKWYEDPRFETDVLPKTIRNG